MKNWLKVLCALLVVLMLLPTLVACNGDNTDGTKPSGTNGNTPGESESETEIIPDINPTVDPEAITGITAKNYNSTLGVLYLEDMFQREYFFADKASGDGMEMAIWRRQNAVKNHLGVSLNFIMAEGDATHVPYETYSEDFQTHIKAKDNKYSLCLSHSYIGVPSLITNNYLADFQSIEGVNLSQDYWNSGIMKQIAYKGGQYLGYSDFNLARTYVVAFNKRIYNDNLAAFGGADDTAYIYNLVKENKWTMKTMFEMAELTYQDNGGDQYDVFGITGELWVPFINFYHSNGISITEATDTYAGNEKSTGYKLSFYGSGKVAPALRKKAETIVSDLSKYNKQLFTHFWGLEAITGVKPYEVKISSQRAFMELLSTNELISLTKVEGLTFGVLPYPMYDEAQAETVGYQSLNWAGYILVPHNLPNEKMVGETLEVTSALSGEVVDYYYNKLLGLKVSDTSLDKEMLSYVWGGLCSDFGITYIMLYDDLIRQSWDSIAYAIPNSIIFNKTWSFYYDSAKKIVNDALIGAKK